MKKYPDASSPVWEETRKGYKYWGARSSSTDTFLTLWNVLHSDIEVSDIEYINLKASDLEFSDVEFSY